MADKKIIYAPTHKKDVISIIIELFREFPKANALGYRLALRNIKAKYRQSVFGLFWALLPPIATSLVWILLRGQGVVDFDNTNTPYTLFIVAGTFLWQIFTQAVQTPIQTVRSNKNILTKINFPREALLYCALYEVVFNIFISLIVVSTIMLFYQVDLGVDFLLFIPGLFILVLIGLAISLMLLPIASLYLDVQFALPTVLQFMMYLTPVIYPKPEYSGWGRILKYNPVEPIITSTRNFLLGVDQSVDWVLIVWLAVGSVLFFLAGIILMRLTFEILIERMGS